VAFLADPRPPRAPGVEPPGSSSYSVLSMSPPALPESVRLKWRHLLRGRGLQIAAPAPAAATASRASPSDPSLGTSASWQECLERGGGLAHVALSADLAQIDGLIVTLQSAWNASGVNASRLCFHAFALPHQRDFVVEGLRCAFGDALLPQPGPSDVIKAFQLRGTARLLVHALNASRVWSEAGLKEPASDGTPQPGDVMLGESDLSLALRSDTGNLGAVHNFARFSLHNLLPGLARVIYLDVDVVVKGDLGELFDVPLRTVAGAPGMVAAVQRSNQPLRTYVDVLQPAVPNWLPSEAPSFNAGVIVVDLDRWRRLHASKLVAEWLALNARKRLWLHGSQPPLLLLFHDEVVPLHWSWNVDGLGHRLNYPKDVLREAKVLHWTGPLKPWRHHGVNRFLWESHTQEYCPQYSFREHTTTCRPDSWFC
ncbi:unnamed protein product, partial [Polarella glacialis]